MTDRHGDATSALVHAYYEELAAVAPALGEAQNAWLGAMESLLSPDRKTHELIRMVCSVASRNPAGVARHAGLAREVGATWPEVIGSIFLTVPAFGLPPAIESVEHAREGFRSAREVEAY